MSAVDVGRPGRPSRPGLLGGIWRGLRARFYGNNFLVLITIVLFAAMYIVGIFIYRDKNFGSLNSFFDMLNSNPGLIVIAAGMTMVLVSGGIDISVGSQVAMYCMMLAYFMEHKGVSAATMIVVVLVTGIVFGLVQGVLVAYFRIQPFIVTLAGMFFARGMTAMISPQTIDITNRDFMGLATKRIYFPFGGYTNAAGVYQRPFIYLSVVLAVFALLVVFTIMTWTKFGRNVYAVGGGEQSALLMGLNTRRTKLTVYTFNGLLTAFGGFLFCLFSTGGAVEKAQGFEMQAIASSVIGGALLTGGVGNVIGSFFGVLVQTTITKFINFNGTLANGWSSIVLAAIMSFFIILQSVFAYVRNKRR
ncbi:MAG: sugar ABC transporter permease YjfF [Propionibacteriaceae bacterium]|jgi:simple sugar transport system permease protein|nr:sugar ABC transporter permease YjfF [Propionibacteriaceae bacterium]